MPASCVSAPDQAQSAGSRIFIFGCARSGTTLLLNLFHTFSGVEVWDDEANYFENCFNRLIVTPTTGTIVAKRTPTCGGHLVEDAARSRATWIVEMLRDPRDVVTSQLNGEFYCDFNRWRSDVLTGQRLAGWHVRLLRLRYENLVSNPEDAQRSLAAALGLRADHSFTGFVDAVPSTLSEVAREILGGLRPIASDRVTRWTSDPRQRERVRSQLEEHPDMEAMLRWAGYPPTPTGIFQ